MRLGDTNPCLDDALTGGAGCRCNGLILAGSGHAWSMRKAGRVDSGERAAAGWRWSEGETRRRDGGKFTWHSAARALSPIDRPPPARRCSCVQWYRCPSIPSSVMPRCSCCAKSFPKQDSVRRHIDHTPHCRALYREELAAKATLAASQGLDDPASEAADSPDVPREVDQPELAHGADDATVAEQKLPNYEMPLHAGPPPPSPVHDRRPRVEDCVDDDDLRIRRHASQSHNLAGRASPSRRSALRRSRRRSMKKRSRDTARLRVGRNGTSRDGGAQRWQNTRR